VALDEIPPGSVIEFDYLLPVDDETCRQQVDQNIKRHIPDAVMRRKLTIIADGPSAKNLDIWKINGPILAVNRAIQMFAKKGTWPNYWAACDPQELVAGFLPERPPQETTYFVASKCHPAVFQKLKGNKVELWHISDHRAENRWHIAPSSSVTITAAWLMARLGYTDFEFYGWDGCFMDGKHHASNNDDWSEMPTISINYGGKIEGDDVIGGKVFTTTHTWAADAKGAEQFFQLADYFDIGIKIHGDGMFEAARQLIMAA
jgi:hypothetical protein